MIALRPGPGPLDVLCLGAHSDDIEIGCGGTLLVLAERPGLRLRGVVVAGSEVRRSEARASLPRFVPGAQVTTLGLRDGRLPAQWEEAKEGLEAVASEVRPDIVLAPSTDDAHQDHRVVAELAGTVWRDSLILRYEIPKWDGDLGRPEHYVALTPGQARRKVELLSACFPSQTGRDWWDDEVFLGLMRLRGVECRRTYAEAFHSTKVLLDLVAEQEGQR